MARTFRTVGSGSAQTTEPIENNKIPIYDTKADAEDDLANLSAGQIIATKDEGNETSTPVDVVQDGNMHAVTSNAVADSLSYSTTETLTGGKWIDGKPIYRKTFSCGAMPNNAIKLVPVDVSNIGYVISLKGAAYTNTWGYDIYLSLPYVAVDPNDIVQATYENGNIRFITTGDRSMYTTSYITLEYTKTTD